MVQKTVKVVSKAGGVIFTDEDGKWYNVAKSNEELKNMLIANASTLKGKVVNVELNGNFINSFETVCGGTPIKTPAEQKTFTPKQSQEKPKVNFQSNYDTVYDEVIKSIKTKELTKDNIFDELASIPVPTKEKLGLKYMSWGDVLVFGRTIDKDFNYEPVLSEEGTPLFKVGNTGMVKMKVSFPTLDLEYEEFYPILNHQNRGIEYNNIMAHDINNAIQRGFVKVFSKITGLGFYLNRGKNNPDDE